MSNPPLFPHQENTLVRTPILPPRPPQLSRTPTPSPNPLSADTTPIPLERGGFLPPATPYRHVSPSTLGIPSTSSGVPPFSVRSPSLGPNLSATERRRRGKSIPPPPPAAPSVPSLPPPPNPIRTAEIAPAPLRKKRKLSDKLVHEKLSSFVPESAIYNQLLELEKKIDITLFRKKLECQEALRNPSRIPHTLRIYIFNTHANQHQNRNASGNVHSEPPSWTLHISGRLLENSTVNGESNLNPNSNPSPAPTASSTQRHYPFSTFLKKLAVEMNPSCCTDNPFVSWSSVNSNKPVNAFEIKRRGNKEFIAKIQLDIKYIPDRFRLSDALKHILGIDVETKSRIIACLWQYIKGNKLQDLSDPSIINCDESLRRIFGEERLKFCHLASKLMSHLSSPEPIVIYHLISLTQDHPSPYTCYDLTLDFPSPLHEEMKNFMESIENHRDIAELEDKIESDARHVADHCRRRSFFLGFSTNPVDFIHALVASQGRDLRQAAADSARDQEKEKKSDFYSQPWVEDAVLRYLNRKHVTRTDLLI